VSKRKRDYSDDSEDHAGQVMPEAKITYRPRPGLAGCTTEMRRLVAELLAAGLTIPIACRAVGIPKATWGSWNMRGKADSEAGVESVYADWWDAMQEAKAACEANLVRMVCAGSVADWKAAAWLLERRYGQRWARKPEAPETHKDDLDVMSEDELRKVIASGKPSAKPDLLLPMVGAVDTDPAP
jgi:hypothetical protein